MELSIRVARCAAGAVLPLLPDGSVAAGLSPVATHICASPWRPWRLAAGASLRKNGEDVFRVNGFCWLDARIGEEKRSVFSPRLLALKDTESGDSDFVYVKRGYSLAVITLSDKGSEGSREDRSGPEAGRLAAEALSIDFIKYFLIPDDKYLFKSLLAKLALEEKYDLILTSGGTGLSERDIAPETTESLLDRKLPGFTQAMLAASLKSTPRAVLSRAAAGLIGSCLVINLPGSPKAVAENLGAVLPALDHSLKKINGDTTDCGA